MKDSPLLQPKMKPRHLQVRRLLFSLADKQMIAVGGSIGTGKRPRAFCAADLPGLFIGSGGALQRGGPAGTPHCFVTAHTAGILIAWLIIGVMMINVTQALGELSILFPVSGGFFTLAHRMLDPSFAFAVRRSSKKCSLTAPDGLGSSARLSAPR